jgi:hypothetical protein
MVTPEPTHETLAGEATSMRIPFAALAAGLWLSAAAGHVR